MQRLKGIAALVMLFLTMPLARASAAVLSGAKVQKECCERHEVDVCCQGSSQMCCAVQAPADTTLYPGQSVLPLVLSIATVAVHYLPEKDCLRSRYLALLRPAQHSPPGLMIAATTVLRI